MKTRRESRYLLVVNSPAEQVAGCLEAVTERGGHGMALVDVAHWASEAPWLDEVADRLRGQFGTTVEVRVSRRVTDPWTLHTPSPETSPKRT